MSKHFRAYGVIERSEEDNDDLVIIGAASTGRLDSKGTFIDQDSVWDAAKRAGTLPLCWEHDWGAPIGTGEKFSRGDDMLIAQSRVGKDFDVLVTKGLGAVAWSVNNIRALVKQRITRGYSIGFDGDVIEDKNGGPPTIQVRQLFELSLCTLPSNPGTYFGFSRAMEIGGINPISLPNPIITSTGNPGISWTNSTLNTLDVNGTSITTTGKIAPVRFEFAHEENEDHELEVLQVALRSLQEAVADWK